MPASARDVIKQIIEVYPEKDRYTRKDINWLDAYQKKEDTLIEFDLELINTLHTKLQQLAPDMDYVLECASKFGTHNVITGAGQNLSSSVSYYMSTGVLFGLRLNTKPKFQMEQRITLNKTGYSFVIDPLSEGKHPATAIARQVIRENLHLFYGCQSYS